MSPKTEKILSGVFGVVASTIIITIALFAMESYWDNNIYPNFPEEEKLEWDRKLSLTNMEYLAEVWEEMKQETKRAK